MYERVWDEADYVVPPAENGAFFVMTNVVLTPNQTRGTCPEDANEMAEVQCGSNPSSNCREGLAPNLVKGHGTQTGRCVPSDRWLRRKGEKPKRPEEVMVCEIRSWCPVEKDELPLRPDEGPLIPGFQNYTVFIKNSISFSRFGDKYQRKNMDKKICIYDPDDPPEKLCPIFR